MPVPRLDLRPRRLTRRAPHTDEIIDFDAADNGCCRFALDTWAGFVFINLDPDAEPLLDYLADLPAAVAHYPIASLRRARRIEYEVGANWKVIGENYSECYHCPGVHPQLNRLSPVRPRPEPRVATGRGRAAGWSSSTTPTRCPPTAARHGRPPLDGHRRRRTRGASTTSSCGRTCCSSLHPDYVMTHQVWPDRRRAVARRLRVAVRPARRWPRADFDPSDAVDFWDLTNRQDWAVCERQQVGTRSRAYVPGRYSLMEDMVHAFDLMVADGYADDGVTTRFAPASRQVVRARTAPTAAR